MQSESTPPPARQLDFKLQPWIPHTRANLREALMVIFEADVYYDATLEIESESRYENHHPFGERFLKDPLTNRLHSYHSKFRFFPNCNDDAPFYLAVHSRYTLTEKIHPRPLMRIFAFPETKSTDKFKLYYELGSNNDFLIVGQATNHNRAGKILQKEMDSLFALLTKVYESSVYFYVASIPYQPPPLRDHQL